MERRKGIKKREPKRDKKYERERQKNGVITYKTNKTRRNGESFSFVVTIRKKFCAGCSLNT